MGPCLLPRRVRCPVCDSHALSPPCGFLALYSKQVILVPAARYWTVRGPEPKVNTIFRSLLSTTELSIFHFHILNKTPQTHYPLPSSSFPQMTKSTQSQDQDFLPKAAQLRALHQLLNSLQFPHFAAARERFPPSDTEGNAD